MSAATLSPAAEELLEHALTLEEKDRASVAGALIESLYAERETGVDEAWDAEIGRRIVQLDAGIVETIPWSEVKRRLSRDPT